MAGVEQAGAGGVAVPAEGAAQDGGRGTGLQLLARPTGQTRLTPQPHLDVERGVGEVEPGEDEADLGATLLLAAPQ